MNYERQEQCAGWRHRWYSVVAAGVGVLLVVASALKLLGSPSDLAVQVAFVSQIETIPWILLSGAELLVGLWLISGISASHSRHVAMAMFTVFALISGRAALIGQSFCSCFGDLSARPWFMVVLDAGVVVALGVLGHGVTGSVRSSFARELILWIAGGTLICATSVVVLSLFWSIECVEVVQRLRGSQITVSPMVISAGAGDVGDGQIHTLRISNHTDHELAIVGMKGASTGDETPIALAGHGRTDIRIKFDFAGSPGFFKRRVFLFTDSPANSAISVVLVGEVLQAETLAALCTEVFVR